MKVGFCSDLHLDHGYQYLIDSDGNISKEAFKPADVLILAGDIIEVRDIFRTRESSMFWKSTEFRDFLSQLLCLYKKVIFIPGNHEYYGSSIEKCHTQLKLLESEFPGLHYLQNEYIELDDVVFFGSTLWTNLSNPMSEYEARTRMNDYRKITHLNRSLRPSDTTYFHYNAISAMESFFSENSEKKKVVITHHAPSWQSKDMKFRDSTLNDAYMSNLDDFITKHSPDCWIHGHLHCINDYTIGSTQIFSNPRGYQAYEPALCKEFTIKTFNI